VRTADPSAAAVLDPPAEVASTGVTDQSALLESSAAPVTYHVLLLAVEPRRHTCTLPAGIEAGADIEVAGALWTVADVRNGQNGSSATLVCIYAD
jgi:hypothetical protein